MFLSLARGRDAAEINRKHYSLIHLVPFRSSGDENTEGSKTSTLKVPWLEALASPSFAIRLIAICEFGPLRLVNRRYDGATRYIRLRKDVISGLRLGKRVNI